MGKTKTIPLTDLTEDTRFQSRTRTDDVTVADYKEAMMSGIMLPPINVAVVEGTIYIVDGWHRYRAAKECGLDSIQAVVEEMSVDDAVWAAASANRAHGLRRSNADKVRSVEMVLALASAEMLSDREVARKIGVSHEFVRQHRHRDDDQVVDEVVEHDDAEDDESSEQPSVRSDEPVDSLSAAKSKYQAIIEQIDGVRAMLLSLQSDSDGYSVNWNALDADIKNAKRCLTDAMPHAACCYCNGDGCDACKHTGWLGKVALEMAPKNLKKGRK